MHRPKQHWQTIFAATLMAGLVWAPATQAEDAFLKRFVGKWEGRGTGTPADGSEPEAVFCRITGALGASGKLTLSGRCALANDTSPFSAAFALSDKSGAYTGTWQSRKGETWTIAGKQSGNGITFAGQRTSGPDGAPQSSRISIRFQGETAYQMTAKSGSGADVGDAGRRLTSASILFRRK